MESLSVVKFCLWAALFCGMGKINAQRGPFVTIFLTTAEQEGPILTLLITDRYTPPARVSTFIQNNNLKTEITVGNSQPAIFEFTNPQQITGSGTSSRSMVITSNDDITVISRSFKGNSGDVALMYPRDQWGNEYYVITPIDGSSKNYAEFAVLASDIETTITIVLGGPVQYNGKHYNKGDTLTVVLEPFQSLQLQSDNDLSRTMVNSQHPVLLLSGHSCVPGIEDCSQVYEQLQPKQSWGKSYLVSAPSFLSCDSQVYVLASKNTQLTGQSGEEKLKTTLEAGKLMIFKVSASKPLSIHSTEKIQVLLYGCGGNFEGQPFGTFMTKIPDIESFRHTYHFIGQKDFVNNFAFIVAKASSVPGFLFNGKLLQNAKWKAFPGSDYVWCEINYGGGFSSNIMQNIIKPFGLLTIGYSGSMVYGTVAAGIRDPIFPLLDSIGSVPI